MKNNIFNDWAANEVSNFEPSMKSTNEMSCLWNNRSHNFLIRVEIFLQNTRIYKFRLIELLADGWNFVLEILNKSGLYEFGIDNIFENFVEV